MGCGFRYEPLSSATRGVGKVAILPLSGSSIPRLAGDRGAIPAASSEVLCLWRDSECAGASYCAGPRPILAGAERSQPTPLVHGTVRVPLPDRTWWGLAPKKPLRRSRRRDC